MRILRMAAAIIAGGLAFAVQADAQGLAGKPVRLIVPYPAGGAGDVISRVLAQQITESGGPNFVIENRPGAGSIIGSDLAARAAPDGTTILLVENPFILGAVLHPTDHYHPVKSFDPICYLADTPSVIAIAGNSPYRTLADFLAAAKLKPGTLSYGSTGPASTAHIAGELLKLAAGVDVVYVPFQGTPPAVNAVLGGHVTAVIANYSDLKSQIDSHALRAIAVPAQKRVDPLPDVATLEEQGFAGIEGSIWFGFVAPAGTPKEVLAQFEKYFTAAISVPAVKAKLNVVGLYPKVSCGDDFGRFIARETANYATFVKDFDIKGE
ncbi:MAG: tripartite tricarboxylate transporter substrate binding protein [Alphaproteobacteria bacterium]|nr:tripartite tricarboxylate transporter substrate binding protein [Alphaproteobacteria bacterium]